MFSSPSDMHSFLRQYGYFAVFAGTFLEGETIVLLAGFLAHQGYMHAPYVALAAFCGGFAGDEAMFMLARHKGDALLRRFPLLAAGVDRMRATVRKSEIPLILGFRFVYGIRNVTPAFLGIHGTPPQLFAPLNAASAAAWSVSFTAAGYFGGQGLADLFGKLRNYEPFIVGGMIFAGVAVWATHRVRMKNKAAAKKRGERQSSPPETNGL